MVRQLVNFRSQGGLADCLVEIDPRRRCAGQRNSVLVHDWCFFGCYDVVSASNEVNLAPNDPPPPRILVIEGISDLHYV